MTREELNQIATTIYNTKNPITITKRDLVNALGYHKRTPRNIHYINNWLDESNLITEPSYINGVIDEQIDLKYKFTIKSDVFQLYSLYIEKYKNLNELAIDFSITNKYCCLIGLNGSGKSNILEAISAIFYSLYHIATLKDGLKKYPCQFKYKISYIYDNKHYEIIDGRLKNGNKVTYDILPKNILALYSGEDTRLWKTYYRPVYEKYCSKMTATQGFVPPFMFYLSRYEWDISLLTLLYSEDVDVVKFVTDITKNAECRISFEYKNGNIRKWEGTEIEAFIEKLKEKPVYTVESFRELINEINFIDQASTLFYCLYKCRTESDNQIIQKINIEFVNNGNIDGLSEGEKKLINANTVIHILSAPNSLCLFDEPDSHIHIARKEELKDLINTENRYSIVTTHSPVFVDCLCNENIKYVKNGKIEDLERCKKLALLSSNRISIFESSLILGAKKILVTEGTYDKKYIEKAISVFTKTNSKYNVLRQISIIPAGSAGNAKALYDDVLSKQLDVIDVIVFLFDYDKGGLDGWKNINAIASNKIIPIFYQNNYNNDYNTERKNISNNDTYMVEDLFSPESYKEKVEYIHQKNTHKDFRCNEQGKTTDAIKQHIESHYLQFNDEWFEGFKPVLNKLITVFNL
ncbi:ATP-dependent endonuclease [Bacteroides caecimuris]|jgi:ABC-type cobalamin/Fe3+-siderophores transport system ATPase subunit|uniref:ATP-dependent nuclease n=1 Tax=Bacteroides caecimuris TaxID=1796613 RepID=UPI00265D0462|nr:AAA family ATPase [Bacteroides caecimuris]